MRSGHWKASAGLAARVITAIAIRSVFSMTVHLLSYDLPIL
jgi:hypothetical protein